MNRVPRLRVEELPQVDATFQLDVEVGHRLLRVLRVRPGQELELLDGHGGRARATLVEAGPRPILECRSSGHEARIGTELVAWMPVIRPERLETAVEKLTELGIARIALYQSAFTGNQRASVDCKRLERIADAALEQSGNPWRPDIDAPVELAEMLDSATPQLLTALPQGDWTGIPREAHGPLALLAGPEGGFSAEELAAILKRSTALVRLGPHVLRAETAMITLAGLVQVLHC